MLRGRPRAAGPYLSPSKGRQRACRRCNHHSNGLAPPRIEGVQGSPPTYHIRGRRAFEHATSQRS